MKEDIIRGMIQREDFSNLLMIIASYGSDSGFNSRVYEVGAIIIEGSLDMQEGKLVTYLNTHDETGQSEFNWTDENEVHGE